MSHPMWKLLYGKLSSRFRGKGKAIQVEIVDSSRRLFRRPVVFSGGISRRCGYRVLREGPLQCGGRKLLVVFLYSFWRFSRDMVD